ncbi:hypothetical protein AAA214_02920 [Parabacteroides goldsteinii]|uniref:hypothetical protein n=1 Tax=Parabacteroides goldsteinii TaxID=328812 RepID=UPI002A7F3D36|nr:hypothetical protein [Parabacteroides goldsteinii]
MIELKSRETLTNTPGGIVQSVFDILVSKAKEQGCIRSILQLTAVSIIVIMRYALRNQDKIRNALGEDLLLRLLESLKQGFELWGDNIDKQIESVEGHPYPLLTLNDAGHSNNVVAFYVIKKQYNVYTLAFKEFIG